MERGGATMTDNWFSIILVHFLLSFKYSKNKMKVREGNENEKERRQVEI